MTTTNDKGTVLKKSVPKRIAGAASWIFPFKAAKSQFEPGMRSGRRIVVLFAGIFSRGHGRAAQALKSPPKWESIEELEAAWGVTEEDRPGHILRLKRSKAVLIFIVACAGITLIPFNSGDSLFSLVLRYVVSTSIIITMSTVCLTVSWRLYVLVSREPLNFVDYVKGIQQAGAE